MWSNHLPHPKTSDEADEWGDDDGYVDLFQVIERLDLTSDASDQPETEDDHES